MREGVPLKEAGSTLKSMPLGTGLALILGFGGVGMLLPLILPRLFPKSKICKEMQAYINLLGPTKYFVVQSHVLMMIGTVGKIFLRLVFNVKYVIETPWFKI